MTTMIVSTALLSAAGCATTANPDPLEPFNRKVFAFNEGLDHAVIKPVATSYAEHIPSPVKTGVSNFFGNTRDLWSAANLFLQGEVRDGSRGVGRFVLNSTVGVLGIFDVATGKGLVRRRETFGNTLGVWGIEPGAYIILPLLGPSTARNAAGVPLDLIATPLYFVPSPTSYVLTGTDLVSTRASLLALTNMVDQMALDKYLYVRDAYLQRVRQTKRVQETDGDMLPPAAASPASAPFAADPS